jgi:hypothetical protein
MSQDQEMDRRHALKLTALTATGLIIIGSPMREAQAQKDKDKDKDKGKDKKEKGAEKAPPPKFAASDSQTKMLDPSRAKKLTPAAAKLTKGDLVKLGEDPDYAKELKLTQADISSIKEAWKGVKPPKGVPTRTGKGGSPITTDISCCCCTPCCCAAAVRQPVRVA